MVDFSAFKRTKQPIVTSKPIFQHSSSFIDDDIDDDDDDPKTSPELPLPLFHNRPSPENAPSPPRPKSQARLHMIFHFLNIIFTTTSLSLLIAAIPIWNANFQHTQSIISGDYTDGLVLAPLFLSLFTSLYLIIVEHTSLGRHIRLRLPKDKSSPKRIATASALRPKTLVLISSTLLLTLALTLTLSATNSLALVWRSPQRTKNGLIICNLTNILTRPCQPILFQVGELQIGGIVAGALAWFVWLALLTTALRTWARERKEKVLAARAEKRQRSRRPKRGGHGHKHRRRGDRTQHPEHERDLTRPSESDPHIADLARPQRAGTRAHRTVRVDRGRDSRVQCLPQFDHHTGMRNCPPAVIYPAHQTRVESSAAALATQTLRPKESMQAWLNKKHSQN